MDAALVGPSPVGRGRGFNLDAPRSAGSGAPSSHGPPIGFAPTDVPRGPRGVESMTVTRPRPPPGFSSHHVASQGGKGVEALTSQMNHVQIQYEEEDWG